MDFNQPAPIVICDARSRTGR